MPNQIRQFIDQHLAANASAMDIVRGISHEFHLPARTAYELLQEYLQQRAG
ncbi:hypothetical protein [Chitinilyticum aquatile]|uniref:hypothetical protein n=1 Tax=Chitinilyticum aquatile TaxID=362520 RepID=UPI000428A17F|nr:hypothetical protein [Chitinilyticum aquatile]